ncbi:hypothetical protein AAFN85_20615 [Mucilaginibacter sp. CAU 1740]|uniref:hypothetical protein n=1 Tax=Mucilaginibacter sp. CAU 1740 TaxID=3140365 RepID=UPI00325A4FC4
MRPDNKLLDVIINLQARGFNHDFVIENEHIRCLQYNELISPDDFEILEMYHCGGSRDSEGDNLVYAIRLNNYQVDGILMSNYRSYIKGMSLRLWAKFNTVIKLKLSPTE